VLSCIPTELTIHMQLDAAGYRIVYIVDSDGIQGAQVKAPEDTTGLIDRTVLVGLVRPVRRGINTLAGTKDELAWRACSVEELVKRVRLVHSPDGDWHAMAADPMQMAEIVGRAEKRLGSR
jgi:hypothetical protein